MEIILGVILVTLLIASICWLNYKSSYDSTLKDILAITTTLIVGGWLLGHIIILSTKTYVYNVAILEREAIVETLEQARTNNNNIELASITKEIIDYNKNLKRIKYNTSHWYFRQYYDSRFLELESIK